MTGSLTFKANVSLRQNQSTNALKMYRHPIPPVPPTPADPEEKVKHNNYHSR